MKKKKKQPKKNLPMNEGEGYKEEENYELQKKNT